MLPESEIYLTFNTAAPFIIAWLLPFLLLTFAKICFKRPPYKKDHMIAGELPGLPLVLMHSYLWGLSIYHQDPISFTLFVWWGPGFLIFATLILAKYPVNWKKVAAFTSVACKFNYIAIVAVLFYYNCHVAIFTYSVWIIHDQVRLNWFQLNADRCRRTSEDLWIFRICYPGFLLLPVFIQSFIYRPYAIAIGIFLFLLWILALMRTIRHGAFKKKPESFTDNLRDIIYLKADPE